MGIVEKQFLKNIYRVVYSVEPQEDAMRLDQFLQHYMPSFSRERVKNRIKNGDITILKRPGKRRPSCILKYADKVEILTRRSTHEDEYWMNEKIQLNENPTMILKNDDFIVLNKPAFMSTHPTGRHLFFCATTILEQKFPEIKTIHSVHRLDRETSGALLLATNSKSANTLTQYFEESKVLKTYFFISKNINKYQAGDKFLAKERLGALDEDAEERVLVNAFEESSHHGKHAETSFYIIKADDQYAYGFAFPKTGRQHQIRVHARAHGLPLIGDKLYLGGYELFQRFKDNEATLDDHQLLEIPRHALHAYALKIPNNETFICPIDDDLANWISHQFAIEKNQLHREIAFYFKKAFQCQD